MARAGCGMSFRNKLELLKEMKEMEENKVSCIFTESNIMDFNYYSFILNGKERIFYTYDTLDNEEDILSWAVRYGFIAEGDAGKCSNIRLIPPSEVETRNKELYKEWWNKHKNDSSSSGKTPPTIGEAQLN